MEIHGNPDDSCGELAVNGLNQQKLGSHYLIISFHC